MCLSVQNFLVQNKTNIKSHIPLAFHMLGDLDVYTDEGQGSVKCLLPSC